MSTPIDEAFYMFEEDRYKDQVKCGIRHAKNVYEKYGKQMAHEIARNKLYNIMCFDGAPVHFTLIQLYIYRNAYYPTMKHFKHNWTIDDIRATGYNDYWKRYPWQYKDQHILKSIDEFNNNENITYDYLISKERFDFEYKFSTTFDYINKLVKPAWKYIYSQYCKNNSLGCISDEEREILYYIISKLSSSYKQNIINTVSNATNYEDVYTLISNLQDELYTPLEFTIHLVCTLVLQRKMFIFAGNNCKLNSYIYNGNIRHDFSGKSKIFSFPIIDGEIMVGSTIVTNTNNIVSLAMYSNEETVNSDWVTNKLFVGFSDNSIYYYNFDDCSWKTFSVETNIIKDIYTFNTLLIVVETTKINVYDITTSTLLYTINNTLLLPNIINFSNFENGILIVSDTVGNIGSVVGITKTTHTENSYTSTTGIALRGTNNISHEITAIRYIEYTNENNDINKTKKVVLIGYDNGAIASYFIDYDFWAYSNGTTSKTTSITTLTDDGNSFKEKIIDFIIYNTTLLIVTDHGIGSYGLYNDGLNNTTNVNTTTITGPGFYGRISDDTKLGKITAIFKHSDSTINELILSTSKGKNIIYYIDSKTWEETDTFIQDFLGKDIGVNVSLQYTVPFTEVPLKSELYIKRFERSSNLYQPITNKV